MVTSCAALNCVQRFEKGSRISFHSFPSKPEILEKWLVNMKRENFRPTQYSKLCSKHFEIHCFDTERFGHTFLKEGSVPTIFNFRKHLTKKTFRQKPPKKHNKISSAVKSITPPPPTPQPPISTKCFVGDFENSDMNRPTSAERCLFVARSAVSSQRKIIKNIVKKNSRTKNKTVSLQSIESHLQEKLLRNENAATLKASFFGPAEELRGLVKEPVVMDVVKLEPLIDPLALRTSDNIDLEENIPLCEEVNSLNLCSTEIKVESENHNNDMTSGIKFEEIPAPVNFPMVKHEAEEGNVLDLHMTPIKTECIDQTCDLTSEIKVEENSMKINFPMMKNEAEERSCSMDTLEEKFVLKPFKCDVCGDCFWELEDLKNHGRQHIRKKSFVCDICGKCFSYYVSLNIHTRQHTGEKPYKCNVCGKCFSLNSSLKVHERQHRCEKSFMCDICGRCFSKLVLLKRHGLVHTSEKPFKCDVCKMNFSLITNLKMHARIHTGEKPFKCDVCGKCLTRSGSLIGHLRVHTGEKPFKCHVCGKSFSESRYLVRHANQHG
ncbi:uncharacterized protein [Periplaneta americana]|uniref:uncharacterized protein isoform X2 n=1 Tax=Periplaneta americana TaxID=6978 RepID=UPI0037E760DC